MSTYRLVIGGILIIALAGCTLVRLGGQPAPTARETLKATLKSGQTVSVPVDWKDAAVTTTTVITLGSETNAGGGSFLIPFRAVKTIVETINGQIVVGADGTITVTETTP